MLTARETIERHCKAAVEGKMDIVAGDVTPELAANLQPLAEKLGSIQPTGYEILNETKDGNNVVFTAEYKGSAGSVKVQSTWEVQGDVWKAFKAEIL